MNVFLQNRFERWIAARHMPQKTGIVLDRRHVYILPSAHGIAYGVLMIILFLWSVNYNNSMGFALTFLLAAIALNAMWRCHNNLLDLRASALGAESPFAGQPARFSFVLEADDNQPRYDLEFRWPGETATVCVDIPADTVDLQVPKPTTQRGWLRPGRLRVDTRYPLGLFRAWSWLNFEQQCLVYPQPQGARRLPKLPGEANGANQAGGSVQGSEDFAGLQRYRAGDSPRHIAWRASSRTGELEDLQVKRFATPKVPELWLDWDSLAPAGTESRLHQLCQWVLQADQMGYRYGLRLPNQIIPLDQGAVHRQACLRALALYGLE